MSTDMEVVIDLEYPKGCQNEMVVRKPSVAAKNVSDSFRFTSPYSIPHGSDENGLKWEDGHKAYHEMYTMLSEAVAWFVHLYVYDVTKWKFLSELFARQILILQDFNCPQPSSINHRSRCCLPCHKFPNVSCSTKTAHFLHDLLM